MEDLATAHSNCEYTKLESLETITWADRNGAEIKCAKEGTISKKTSFNLVGSSTTPSTLRRRAAIVLTPHQPTQSRSAVSPLLLYPR